MWCYCEKAGAAEKGKLPNARKLRAQRKPESQYAWHGLEKSEVLFRFIRCCKKPKQRSSWIHGNTPDVPDSHKEEFLKQAEARLLQLPQLCCLLTGAQEKVGELISTMIPTGGHFLIVQLFPQAHRSQHRLLQDACKHMAGSRIQITFSGIPLRMLSSFPH